jgi:alanyl aminopeptidase
MRRCYPPVLLLGLLACQHERQLSPSTRTEEPVQVARADAGRLRLDGAALPIRYALRLRLDPTQDNFSGTMLIDLIIKKPLNTLWLHGKDLKVEQAILQSAAESVRASVVEGESEKLGFNFERQVGPGSAQLRVNYQGLISTRDGRGLFRQREQGDWYLISQFESHYARLAFPCFDEPAFKVPWQVTLEVRPGDLALSNTEIASEREGPSGFRTVTFAETKPLPSYLIAIAVGPFEVVNAGSAGQKGTPIRIIAPRGRGADANYAATVSPSILELLESYFGMPYPYSKLDVLSIPLSTQFDATENAGLVTMTQSLLIARPEHESIQFKRRYASAAAHEFGHMWFGDLVTTAWWDDVWLNEGFATWITAKVIELWKPEWSHGTLFANIRNAAMSADALVSARQVRQPIASEHDIANAFDTISYQKGASVLRMFENWIGEDIFRRGIHRYLERHAWGNATAADFLGAIAEEAGKDIRPAFSTFLDQPGVALLTVALRCERGAKPKLALAQERFLPEGSTGDSEQVRQIPVCARFKAGKAEGRACTLLSRQTGELELSSATQCPDWVLANEGELGYYRALHSGSLSQLLNENWKQLSLPEQVGFLNDQQALVASGKISYGEVLGFVPELARDPRREIVLAAVRIVQRLKQHLISASLRPTYSAFIRRTFGPRAKALGWKARPGEDEDTQLTRAPLLSLVVNAGEDKALQAEATVLAREWLRDRRAIEPEAVESVLITAAASGDRDLFDLFRAEAHRAEERVDRLRLLRAVGAFHNREILSSALGLVLSEEFDPRESISVLRRASAEAETRDLAYAFIKQNFEALVKRLPRDSGARLPDFASGYCDREHRADVEAFFKDRSTQYAGGPRRLAQTLERISLCIALKEAQQPSVNEFFQKSTRPVATRLKQQGREQAVNSPDPQ